MKEPRNILFLCPYPKGESPSQRFRFEQYLDHLTAGGFSFKIMSFFDLPAWKALYQHGNTVQKIRGVIKGLWNRLGALWVVHRYDFIFIHREAAPIGPPIVEFLISRVFHKKIIYDFDDAIWLPNTSDENKVAKYFKWHSKVSSICRWSYKVSCGNRYLCDYATQFNPQVIYNPTTIDTENLHNPALHSLRKENNPIIIGWTGTHSTIKYLEMIPGVIKSLDKKFPGQIQLVIIADENPRLEVASYQFVPWSKETEITDLLQFDVGIMPLPNDAWSKGKCGFKVLQYLALEIPAVASPVGVNPDILDRGDSGFLASTATEWEEALERLIRDPQLRRRMGSNGREKVIHHYSVTSNTSSFLKLFE